MLVLVCGGRDYRDYNYVNETLDDIALTHSTIKITIIQGGARGADTFARHWACLRNVPCITIPAKWHLEGRAAGVLRNQRMLDEFDIGLAVVFPGGRGTQDMIRRLTRANIHTLLMQQ